MKTASFWIVLLIACLSVSALPAAEKVDLNRADIEELTTLPGVGPALAERIVEYRRQNDGFRKIEDLLNVRGIGEKKFAQLEDRITVTPPAKKKGDGKAPPR